MFALSDFSRPRVLSFSQRHVNEYLRRYEVDESEISFLTDTFRVRSNNVWQICCTDAMDYCAMDMRLNIRVENYTFHWAWLTFPYSYITRWLIYIWTDGSNVSLYKEPGTNQTFSSVWSTVDDTAYKGHEWCFRFCLFSNTYLNGWGKTGHMILKGHVSLLNLVTHSFVGKCVIIRSHKRV